MLYLVGLGLSDETDITVKGLDIVRKASRVYLESYTAILLVEKSVLVSPSLQNHARADADDSRNNTMAEKSLSRIVKWWSLPVMRS